MSKTRYIYILSSRYSGSTLLSFLLAAHPEIGSIGERRKFFNKTYGLEKFPHHRATLCSCGQKFSDCTFLPSIKERIERKSSNISKSINFTEYHFSENKYLNKLSKKLIQKAIIGEWPIIPMKSRLEGHHMLNNLLISEILERQGASVFVDSSKSLEHLQYLSTNDRLDIRVIWLLRNPRGQCQSAIKYNPTWGLEHAAQKWNRENDQMLTGLEQLKLPYMILKYEDLCAFPEKWIEKMGHFINVEKGGFDLNFRNQDHHILGNGSMRLGGETEIVLREGWKEKMSGKDQKRVLQICRDFEWIYPA